MHKVQWLTGSWSDPQVNAMALMASRSAVEYGDDVITDAVRNVLRKRFPTNDTEGGDDLEQRVDGMEAMLNWDEDLVRMHTRSRSTLTPAQPKHA